MDIQKVKEIIAKHAKIDIDKLDGNLSFKNDLHLDSIDLFQIVMEVEDTFNIKVDNDELLKINTVKDALDCVENVK